MLPCGHANMHRPGGGHTGTVSSSVLVPLVVDAVGHRVPVVAAGGVFDGRGLAASLMYGAAGVWVGTRFLLTPEARCLWRGCIFRYSCMEVGAIVRQSGTS